MCFYISISDRGSFECMQVISITKVPVFLCTDINPEATRTTLKTAQVNDVVLECIQTDLVHGLERVFGSVDLLIFNPPYVVTPPEEVGSQSIEAAWAGGIDGRQVTDRLLPLIPVCRGRALTMTEIDGAQWTFLFSHN